MKEDCNVEIYMYGWENKKDKNGFYYSLMIYNVYENGDNTLKWSVNNTLCTRFGVRMNKLKNFSFSYLLRKLFEINKLPGDLVHTFIPSQEYLQIYKSSGNKNRELGLELLKYLEAVEKKNDLVNFLIEELKKIPKD